jgi:hypothetical protein
VGAIRELQKIPLNKFGDFGSLQMTLAAPTIEVRFQFRPAPAVILNSQEMLPLLSARIQETYPRGGT